MTPQAAAFPDAPYKLSACRGRGGGSAPLASVWMTNYKGENMKEKKVSEFFGSIERERQLSGGTHI